jgi:hypothetical protein
MKGLVVLILMHFGIDRVVAEPLQLPLMGQYDLEIRSRLPAGTQTRKGKRRKIPSCGSTARKRLEDRHTIKAIVEREGVIVDDEPWVEVRRTSKEVHAQLYTSSELTYQIVVGRESDEATGTASVFGYSSSGLRCLDSYALIGSHTYSPPKR